MGVTGMNYLYNGIPLPAFPAYDTAAFPYAVIDAANGENTSFLLILCENRPYYGVNPQDSTKKGVYNTGQKRAYYFVMDDGQTEWEFQAETDNPLTADDEVPGGIFWTNTDIISQIDGSVWLAASDPVPVGFSESWLRSFKEMLALGLCSKARIGTSLPPMAYIVAGLRKDQGGDPVAYLYGTPSESGNIAIADGNGYVRYNGVVLSPLPEWDKAAYPYAVISPAYDATNGEVIPPRLYCSPLPWTGKDFVGIIFWSTETKDTIKAEYVNSAWSNFEAFPKREFYKQPVWANHDVLWITSSASTVDGTDLLASDPIPLTSDEHTEAVYGSTRLPVFPDYNAEKYPYAILLQERDFTTEVPKNYYTLHVFDRQVTLKGYSYSPIGEYVASSFTCFNEYYNSTGWAGIHLDVSNPHWQPGSKSLYLWSNFDFMKEDGSVVIATSPDPIPVYEQRKE